MNDTPPMDEPSPPFTAYVGNEPYIIVSHAPEDRALVYPELLRLHQAGYRVWYDDGTATGDARTAAVETAILNCSLFLVFVSPRLAGFGNARHEIQLAVDEARPIAAVYLEPTEPKPVLKRLLHDQTSLHRHALSEALYHEGLRRVLPEATQAQTPFDAYLGEKPFIFVSYSHKDSALVFPQIRRLHQAGYRIWYDQGIPIGSNWRGSIGDALEKCAVFLLFLTPRAAASVEVFAEVYIGFERWKKSGQSNACHFVVVYLEPTPLPARWYFLHQVQGLLPYQVPTTAYRRALDNALDTVKGIRGGDHAPEPIAAGIISTDTPKSVEPEEYEVTDVPPLPPMSMPAVVPPSFPKQWVKPRRKLNVSVAGHFSSITPKNAPAGDSVPVQSVPEPSKLNPATKLNPKDGAEMILIPAGEFLMGDDGLKYNPRHTVNLDAYYIYKNLVTVAQYREFCNSTHRKMPDKLSGYLGSKRVELDWKDDHPMVNVDWEDASAYCKWAGGYLPTEAQWEKAARGVDGRKYPWGNEWDNSRLQCSNKSYGDAGRTAPVGSFPGGASPYGLLDMAGNVWQWCADWHVADYYKNLPNKNPQRPERARSRVVRGGSWRLPYTDTLNFRAAYRFKHEHVYRSAEVGFRCASEV